MAQGSSTSTSSGHRRGWTQRNERIYDEQVRTPANRPTPAFNGRDTLRRAGMTARQTAGLGGRTARGASSSAGFDAAGWGSVLLYVLSSIVLLALLKTMLEGRGPAAVEKSLGFLGGAWARFFSPVDPIIGQGPATAPAAATATTGGPAAAGAAAVGSWVGLAPGADRPGARTKPQVLAFVAELGRRVGRRLTIATGTNHSRLTVDGNVSDHWNGWAADVPASGAELTRLGRTALVEAGMPAAQANRANGGIYNVGAYQIIFNTTQGGNHFDHLHVGLHAWAHR